MNSQKQKPGNRKQMVALLGVTAVAVLLVLLMGPAQAAPVAAPVAPATGIIYVDADAKGANNGSSWKDAYPNLRDALSAWKAGEEFWIAEGRYFPDVGGGETAGNRNATFWTKGDMKLYGGFKGSESALDQRNPAAHVTVLSGDIDKNDNVDGKGVTLSHRAIHGANSYNVVVINGAGNTVLLDGLVVSGGDAAKTAPATQGGGILIHSFQDAHPVISNLRIQGNRAFESGGGLMTTKTPLIVSDTVFRGNAVEDEGFRDQHQALGGGMYVAGAEDANIPVLLLRVLFESNLAEEAGGLGSYGIKSTGLSLDDVQFTANTAIWSGGGMANGNAHPILTNVQFLANRVESDGNPYSITPDHGGGGLHLGGPAARPTLTNVQFIANESRSGRSDCPLTGDLKHGYGGGLHVFDSVPNMTNILFSGNRADGYGGAMFLGRQSPSTDILEMTNITVVGNFSQICDRGHAIMYANVDPVRVSNGIFWNNGRDGENSIWSGFPAALGFRNSVVQGCDFGGTFDPIKCGTDLGGNLNVDPKLVAQTRFAGNPTASGNNRLTLGSPAVDKGDNSFLPSGITKDLDNRQRIVDGDGDSSAIVDMGAYELPFICPPKGSHVLRVDKDATGANTGLTWADALLTVQDALLLYEQCPGAEIDEIWVAEGVYYPDEGGYFGLPSTAPLSERSQRSFHLTNDGTGGIHLFGGFTGTETSSSDRTDPAAHVTVLSGDIEHNDVTDAHGVVLNPGGIAGTNSTHVLYQNETKCDTNLNPQPDCPLVDGFTVTGGDARGKGGAGTTAQEQGGGMYAVHASANLSLVRFQGNAAILGGGLHLDGTSDFFLDQVTFKNNWARTGGGMSTVLESSPELGTVIFEGNRAIAFQSGDLPKANGGGMYVATATNIETKLEDVLFLENIADNDGGGLFHELFETKSDSPLTLYEVKFTGNVARSTAGDQGVGGALANRATSPQIDRAWFQGNSANKGGAIGNFEGANPKISNTLISGNLGQNTAGAMYNVGSSPELTNVTISGNKVASGAAGIRNEKNSNPIIRNSIASHNGGSPIQNDGSSNPVISYSLFDDCFTEGGWHAPCGTDGGNNIEPEHPWDPIFVHPINPATAPSVLGDFHLARNSSVIDQGMNDYNNKSYDLDGPNHPRRLDGNGDGTVTIDMGAYEAPAAGRLKVVKETVPAGADQFFVFEITFPDPQVDKFDFALKGGETWDSGNLPASTYVLVESRYPGWDLVSKSCDDNNSTPPTINVEEGETVTCTYRNVQRGKIIVDKVTHPSGAQKFPFVLSGGPDNVSQSFALANGDAPHDSGFVKAGSYSVVEANVSDWELSSAVCSDGSDPANIDLAHGETVHCTFTNLEPDSIVILKEANPANGASFNFVDDIAGSNHKFSLTDGKSEAFHNVKPGTYTIIEEDPADYELADIVCSGSFKSEDIDLAKRSVTLTMELGQTAHCTFRNKGPHKTYFPVIASNSILQ